MILVLFACSVALLQRCLCVSLLCPRTEGTCGFGYLDQSPLEGHLLVGGGEGVGKGGGGAVKGGVGRGGVKGVG